MSRRWGGTVWLARWRRRVGYLLARDREEREMDAEMCLHVELEIEERIRQGLAPAEARRSALQDFGGIERFKEEARAARGVRRWDELVQDLRFALRMLATSRGGTALTIGTLAVAIGFSTATYSVVHRLLIRPLPFPNAERLVDIELVTAETRGTGGIGDMPRYGAYRAWREQSTTFEAMAAYELAEPVLSGAGLPARVSVVGVQPHLMHLLGARPLAGRLFTPEENVVGGSPPAILSEGFWTRRFGSDPGVIGHVLILDGKPHHIIGILPDRFRFPVLPAGVGFREAEIWTPLASLFPERESAERRDQAALWVVGRLRPGVSPATAATELDRISERSRTLDPDNDWRFAQVTPLREFVVGDVRAPLLLMLGATLFVLLVACANTANVLMARGVVRRREFGLRAALGAGPRRLTQQLITESVLLALVAGLAGVLLAMWSVPLLVRLGGGELPELGHAGLDAGVLGMALAATTLTGILFGLAPALHAHRATSAALREGTRGAGRSRSNRRVTDALVVAEVALTMILLAGAGVLIHSFARAVRVDLGFEPDHVLVAQFTLPSDRYPSQGEQLAFARAALGSVEAIGGISAATVATSSPLIGGGFSVVNVPGTRTRLGPRPAWPVATTANYFRVLGIPLLRGQTLDPARPDAVLLDEVAARELFPDMDPIGQTLEWRSGQNRGTVVGIVGNVRQDSPREAPPPHIYTPLMGGVTPRLQILARTEGDPRRYEAAVRLAITDVDRMLVVDRSAAASDLIAESLARQRFYMLLLGAFAGSALLIALGGVYATANAAAAGAARELGVRAALGANRLSLFTLVVRRGLALTVLGCGIGLVGAVVTTRLLRGLLFEVTPSDPLTFGVVVALLCLTALLASSLPGRRAMRTDPMVVIRAD